MVQHRPWASRTARRTCTSSPNKPIHLGGAVEAWEGAGRWGSAVRLKGSGTDWPPREA